MEHYVFYVRVRTDSIFLDYRSLLFYVYIEKVPQKLLFQTLVFTLLLHWNCIFHFEDTNISDLVSHYFCSFSQLCSIDLIQASLHNSCAILLVKCTPLLQVCALLELMFHVCTCTSTCLSTEMQQSKTDHMHAWRYPIYLQPKLYLC